MPLLASKPRARVVIAYKNFGANRGLSHIGLGVSAMQNAKALIAAGYVAEVWPILSATDLGTRLDEDRKQSMASHHTPITHVVISAPWIPTAELTKMVSKYFDLEFAVVSHSNIGFLQADPNAIRLLREGSALGAMMGNFHIAGNSGDLVKWWKATYQTPMVTLPNMYPVTSQPPAKRWSCGVLRIGCFCAVRPYKNVLTAAAAALEIGVRLRVSDLQFYISGGREEGGAGTIVAAIRELYGGIPRGQLILNNWESWTTFVQTVGSMDMMLQPSYTEGFNMVVADGISQGVATVVSDAITWAPNNWKARSDSASDIANKGIALLHDPSAAQEGLASLESHNQQALRNWQTFLRIRFQ